MKVEVPATSLDSETLDALIESFILREGTDYGAVEVSLEAKVRQVRSQIERGDVKVVFDGESDSVSLITKRDFIKAVTI